jgi:hypothetical protein
MLQKVGMSYVDLLVDDKNRLRKNTVDVSNVPADLRKDLADLHSQVREALEMLTMPLPGKVTQPGETWKAQRPLLIFAGQTSDLATMDVTYTYQGIRDLPDGSSCAVISMDGAALDRTDGKNRISGRVTGTATLDMPFSQISSAQVKATLDINGGEGKKTTVALDSKLTRTLGRELLNVRDKLTAQLPRDKKNRPFKDYNVTLEAQRPCVVSLESPKGAGWFATSLRVEDAIGNLVSEDTQSSGVDGNSLIEFTPTQAGTYRIVATCTQPSQGDYLLVVRQ